MRLRLPECLCPPPSLGLLDSTPARPPSRPFHNPCFLLAMLHPVSVQASHSQTNTPPNSDYLPGMPEAAPLSERATLERESRNYEEAISVHGPLVPPAIGGRLLNVTPQAVHTLMERGKLTRLEIFGNPWIPVFEIRARLNSPRDKGGRPRKTA